MAYRTDHTSVWIIEATGKMAHMSKTLKSMGFDPEIIATRGHLCQMPEKLSDVCIDTGFREKNRVPDPQVLERIRNAITVMQDNGGHDVYIATDDDTEGNVIAWDVYESIRDICPDPVRVCLNALDRDSINLSLKHSGPVEKSDAIAGRTRAIIDRLLGSAFAKDGSGGRVASAILGVIAREKPKPWRIDFVARAVDGGRPWRVSSPVNDVLTMEMAEKIISIGFPALDYESVVRKIVPPNDMGRILVSAGDNMNLSPKDAAKAMQSAYESGSLSYPRAGSRGMSRAAAAKMKTVFRKSGYAFNPADVPERPESEPHDSPYPVGPVDISLDPEKIGPGEGIRVLIGRDLVPCGEKRKVQKHRKGDIFRHLVDRGIPEKVASFVDDLEWERDFGTPRPGEKTENESRIVRRRIDSVILESCIGHDIGKPSTWPGHIQNFIDRGIVDGNLQITDIGRDMMAHTPGVLLNPAFSRAVMKACEVAVENSGDREPWEVLAEKIVSSMPSSVRERIVSITEKPEVSMEAKNIHNVDITQKH